MTEQGGTAGTAVERIAEAQREERRRVKAIIERDRAAGAREAMRRRAELEVREGVFVNLTDTVVEPTPEWLEKGETKPYTPKSPDGTIRSVRTVRRVVTPIVLRMFMAGKLTEEQFRACVWYRDRFDLAGLCGRFKSSQISLAGNTGGGGGGGSGQAPMALHEFEAMARQDYRAARSALTAFYLRFFEAIVLYDIPLRRAARFARCRDDRSFKRFRDVTQELVEHCQQNNVVIEQAYEELVG